MKLYHVVVDTNVIVSSFLSPSSPPGSIVHAFYRREVRLCVSRELLSEYLDVLSRPHLKKRIEKDCRGTLDFFTEYLTNWAIFPRAPLEVLPVISEDPDDDIILATATITGADYILSGDRHLLSLVEYKGIKILTPRQFVDIIHGESHAH